ncbi:MAG: VPLPA-CTERM sorting domain-containing protein [Methylococcales bacterium]|nr:VPLPA-CTERM sorting domain-containing protein [Methylococcales bacterium]
MKNFNKTLLAAALLAAGTGAANADIVINSATGSEAFMQAYDSSQKLTFNFDLGITLAQLNAGIGSHTFNFSNDANWNTFHGPNFNAATTQFIVADGYKTQAYFTSNLASPVLAKTTLLLAGSGAIEQAAARINSGTPISAGTSSLATDGINPGTGQWADGLSAPQTIWGSVGDQQAAINYGAAGGNFFGVAFDLATKLPATTEIGRFTLAGSTLTFAPGSVSAVPLPAAVWMFGAGLMGMLRLSRRKSAAI